LTFPNGRFLKGDRRFSITECIEAEYAQV